MVDVNHIRKLVHTYFNIYPDDLYDGDPDHAVHVNPQTGVVDVKGTVALKGPEPQLFSPLPIKFGQIDRNFNCGLFPQLNVINLENFPHTVHGDFRIVAPNMTSLQGAPVHVGGVCVFSSQSLKSLEHLPESYGNLRLRYTPHLPMLRLVMAHNVYWSFPPGGSDKGLYATAIVNKYQGKGKAGVIKCAAELIKAGYKENARW